MTYHYMFESFQTAGALYEFSQITQFFDIFLNLNSIAE